MDLVAVGQAGAVLAAVDGAGAGHGDGGAYQAFNVPVRSNQKRIRFLPLLFGSQLDAEPWSDCRMMIGGTFDFARMESMIWR